MNTRSRSNSSSLPRLSAQEPSTAATPNNPAVTPNPPPSARSDVKAASVLATKTEYFEPWAKAVKLDTIILEIPDEGFGELLALVQVTKSLPRWITDENSAQQKSLQPDFADELVILSQYVSDLTPSEAWNEGPGDMISGGDNQASGKLSGDQPSDAISYSADLTVQIPSNASRSSGNTDSGINNDSSISLHDEPDSALDRALVFIFAIAQRTSQLTHHRIPPNEAELRTAVDSLLMFLFHKKGSISYRLERELKLPESQVPGVRVRTVKPESLLLLELHDARFYLDARPNLRSTYSCLAGNKPPATTLHILHWLVEYKRDDAGERQALMGLVSGINQRLALGITDHFVFAAIHDAPSHLRVVAGIWKNDKIQVYELGSYVLTSPLHVIQFYLLHRAIKIKGEEYLLAISQRRIACVQAKYHRGWAADTPPGSIRTYKSQSSNSPSLTSFAGTVEEEEPPEASLTGEQVKI